MSGIVDVNVLLKVPTGLNILKVDNLDVAKLKTVSIDLKKIKWCSGKEVVRAVKKLRQ